MLISTFQLHNVVKNPVKELGLKPCCLAVLQANNLLPFQTPDLAIPDLTTQVQETPAPETPTQSSPAIAAITPEIDIGNFFRAFKELGKEAASPEK